MIDNIVSRPKAPNKKIRTSQDFELCYLRHQYFRRAKFNPTEQEMQPYMYIVTRMTKNTFFTYFNLFKSVGMHQEDVLNIGRVHLVSFLGLYALENMDLRSSKKKEFSDTFEKVNYKEPEEKDFIQKDRANFTLFFRQRMEDLVRVCRQKVRNIKGQPSEEYSVFCSKQKPPKYLKKLLKNHEDFGYKKLDFAVFKSVRKRAGISTESTVFKFNDIWYVAVLLEQKKLELEDIIGSGYDPYENTHNMQPDKLLMEKESQGLSSLFYKKTKYTKKTTLKDFIAKNKNKRHYKEEIETAKKLLRSLEA